MQSVELEEFTAIRPYVTGIMPESMTGVGEEPGFMATVYLKTSPQADRAEEWTVLIDDLGDIRVERASPIPGSTGRIRHSAWTISAGQRRAGTS